MAAAVAAVASVANRAGRFRSRLFRRPGVPRGTTGLFRRLTLREIPPARGKTRAPSTALRSSLTRESRDHTGKTSVALATIAGLALAAGGCMPDDQRPRDPNVHLQQHPAGTLAIVAIYALLFVGGWIAMYVFVFLSRGQVTP
jgi:hypothetical protein